MAKLSTGISSQLKALSSISELLVLIAVPVVAFSILGHWLDGKFNKKPWIFIISFFLSLPVITFLVIKKGRKMRDEIMHPS